MSRRSPCMSTDQDTEYFGNGLAQGGIRIQCGVGDDSTLSLVEPVAY